MLTERLLSIALFGAEWVLYLLLFLSAVSVTIMIERFLFYRKEVRQNTLIESKIPELMKQGKKEQILEIIKDSVSSEARVLEAGIEGAGLGEEASNHLITGALAKEQHRLEKNLAYLGTVGSNAPFIGLFGTVLGIIQAFNDLSLDIQGGAQAVMSGISEALIATAVGLFVAIPAVVAYNIFQRKVAKILAQIDNSAQTLLAYLHGSK
jgi:biopolymer transport protein ExbB